MKDLALWESKFKPCYYFYRLFDKLSILNESAKSQVNMLEIKKAIYYAKKYHGSQMRQSGESYYSHPLEVAYMVSSYLFRTDIIITSILHDTIEDTALTYDMIKSLFGLAIADQVMDLTRVKEGGRKISSAEMVESLFKQRKYDLLLIKQFDRLHNLRTLKAKSPEKIKAITEETIASFITLAAHLGTRDIEEELVQLCTMYVNPLLLDEKLEIPFGDDSSLISLISQNGEWHKCKV